MTLVIAQGHGALLRLPTVFSPSVAKLQAGSPSANWFAGVLANAALQLATAFVPSVATPFPAQAGRAMPVAAAPRAMPALTSRAPSCAADVAERNARR